ncbi:type II secretion system protein [Akkermansiaceae bacterium]|nr:type II secretion system protein [Akkermansiaceae bacterium]
MKRHISRNGFTLVEMTVVIMVLMTLLGTGLYVSKQYGNWQLGRAASEQLRTVYAAQRLYLADNPTATISSITTAQIVPYLPSRATSMPTVTSLTGNTLNIRVNVTPPNINNGSGGVYDPSGSSTDSLWDVGQ